MRNFAVYSKDGCPYCSKIQEVLKLAGLNFVTYKLGKDFDNADKASGDIFPAKKVSTILYSVWKSVPTIAGTANFLTNCGTLSLSKFIFKILFGICASFQVFLQDLFVFVSF